MPVEHSTFPRYFIASSQADASAFFLPGWNAGVVRLTDAAGRVLEQVVAVGVAGGLSLVAPETLPDSLRHQLARHELALGRPPLEIQTRELWLCELHHLEEDPDETADLLEPVSCLATLTGPFPDGPRIVAQGRLTLRRADLLEALVQAAGHPFLAADDGSPVEGHRCFGLMLPVDRPERLSEGEGMVLAYPALPPAELKSAELVNESGCRRLMWEILQSARRAAEKAGDARHPLLTRPLPVPNREEAIQKLQEDGYTLEGDVAVRRRSGGLGGLLGSVFGATESLPIPREGSWEDYVELARAALAAIPGWPDARAQALRARLGSQRARRPAGIVSPGATNRIPNDAPAAAEANRLETPAPARSGPRQPPGGVPRKADPRDWMADFATPVRPGAPQAPERKKPAPAKGRDEPRKDEKKKDEAPSGRPDWMKDFE